MKVLNCLQNFERKNMFLVIAVSKNIIATTKMRNNYAAIQLLYRNIGLFSIAPCKVITLNPFWYQFFASFFMALSLKLSLFQLSQQQ